MEKFAKQNSLKLFNISSKLNKGINELFETMTRDIMHSGDQDKMDIRSSSIKLGAINNDYFTTDEQGKRISSQRGSERPNLNNCCV